jgi:C_GCAxxG_C_C family probable redox protein
MPTNATMTDKQEAALRLFDSGFNCSQSVCAALASDLGFSRADALRVAAAFGGGIGRSGATCGAVTGALMALGVKYGMTEADPQAKERMYTIAQGFLARFTERHGTVTCKGLLDADIATDEGRRSMHERNTHVTICTGVVADAVAIAEDMMK